jgi:hypothetical protein
MSRLLAMAVSQVALISLVVFLSDSAIAQEILTDPDGFSAGAGVDGVDPSAFESLAGRSAWKRITLGRYGGVNALREALDKAGVRVGEKAGEILGRPAFSLSALPLTVDLVVLTPGELGFVSEALQANVYRRAMQFGFELCRAEVAPLLRLAYLEQPIGEFLRKPVETWSGKPVDLTVANAGTGLILFGGESRSSLILVPDTKLVFVRPQRIALPDAR